MTTRKELLQRLWGCINRYVIPYYIEGVLVRVGRIDEPFADSGAAIERSLAAGAARRDLCVVLRYAAYRGIFDALYEIDQRGQA